MKQETMIKTHYLQRYKHQQKAEEIYRKQLFHKSVVLKLGSERAEELKQAALCEHQIITELGLPPVGVLDD